MKRIEEYTKQLHTIVSNYWMQKSSTKTTGTETKIRRKIKALTAVQYWIRAAQWDPS